MTIPNTFPRYAIPVVIISLVVAGVLAFSPNKAPVGVLNGRNVSVSAKGVGLHPSDQWPVESTQGVAMRGKHANAAETPLSAISTPRNSIRQPSIAKAGDSADGRIKRLRDEGATATYALSTENLPAYTTHDALAITLTSDGPTALDRLSEYEPRQSRFPNQQGGLYYRLEVGDKVVFWGQAGTPGVVSFDSPQALQDEEYARIKKSLASQSIASIQIPSTAQAAVLKVWEVTATSDLQGDLGLPLYNIQVPASQAQ